MPAQTHRRRHFAPQSDETIEARPCDMPGCPKAGEYRAPKSRDRLTDYYWFCLEHVQSYNRSWNYLSGMTDADVERMVRADTVWQRPSWRVGVGSTAREDALRQRIYREFGLGGSASFRADAGSDQQQRETGASDTARAGSPEADRALAVLDLSWPVDFATIKARYRALAKRHHPDANNGSREAEEVLKSINEAYAILRASFAP